MKTKLALAILLLTLLFSFEKGMAQAPAWEWANSAGGTSADYGNNICTDPNGNVLVTGIFSGDSITFGTITLMGSFAYNIFVVKYDPLGNVLWAKSAGGTGFDEGYSIATDASGNVLLTGAFGSDSITFGTTTLTNATPPSPDVFIVKYDALGNVLWAKSAGGTGWDLGYKITSDASGNVVLTGYFESATITFGTTTLTNSTSPNGDIFIVKYDASGNVLWTKSTGGTKDDAGYCISTDASGNILLTGVFESDSITFGTTILTNANADSSDIFVVKYDASGNVLWAKSAGGGSDDISTGISTDVSGNVIITGRFQSASITFGTTTLSKQFIRICLL